MKIRIEQWPFLLFVASLPFASVLHFRFYSYPVQIADILFLLAAAAWIAAFAIKRRSVVRSRFYIFLAAYAIAVVLSTIASANPAFSSIKLLGKFYLIGIALLSINSITSTDDLKRIVQAWLVGAGIALLLSFVGLLLFYAGFTDPSQNIVLHPIYGSLPPGNYRRIEGFFFYPSMLANFIGITWMFVLLALSSNWIKPRTVWIYAAVLFVVDLFTLTPGLGGICITTGYVVGKHLRDHGMKILGRTAIAAGILIATVFFITASITMFSFDPNGTAIPVSHGMISPSHRTVAWKTAFETFLKDPFFGRGVGMPVANSKFVDPSGNSQILTDAHNTYISLLGETGILGFAAFMGIIVFLTFGLFKMRNEDTIRRSVRIFFLLALADAFFYQSLTGSYEDSRHLWVLFGTIAAMLAVSNKSNK